MKPEAVNAKHDSPVIDITAEASCKFNWRGKSMSAEELGIALQAEKLRHPITEVRLLEGDIDLGMKQVIRFSDAVKSIGLKKAYFERGEEFETVTWPDAQ